MKPKHLRLAATCPLIAICLVVTANAQTTRTWIGTDANTATADNWDPSGAPSATAGDIMLFDGSSLFNNLTFPGGTFSGNPGLGGLIVTAGQTGALSLNNTGGGGSVFRLRANANITIEPGAAAFSFGTASNTVVLNLNNTVGSANTFLNNSANLATLGTQVSINASGGNNGQAVFDGTGNWLVAGTTTANGLSRGLIKNGSGTLTLSGTNNHTGLTTVNAGTLALGNVLALQNSTLNTGSAGTQQVAFTVPGANTYQIGGLTGEDGLALGVNSVTVGSNNASTTYSGSLAGSGTFTKSGTGILTLVGDLTGFTGNLTLSSGTTVLASNSGGGLTLVSGATLRSEATVAGNMIITGGQLAVNPLTAASLATSGDLTLTGTTSIILADAPANTSPFTVLSYGGTLTGGAANLQLPGGADMYRNPVFNDATPGQITLSIGSETRTWSGGEAWDINNSLNWQEGDKKFFQLDSVVFTDTGAGTISLVGNLAPSSVTVASNVNYIFSGSPGNQLTGGSLTKTGDGSLFLASPNSSFSGITIQQGTIVVQNNQALGANGNQITISAGGALDFNGAQTASRDYAAVIAGTGVGGTGAVVNTGGNHNQGLGTISLAADATIGGTGRWDLRPIVAGTGVLDLNNHTLTKTGSGVIALVDSAFTSDGTIVVNQGELRYSRTSTGDSTGLVSVQSGASFIFENNVSGVFGWNLAVEDGTIRCFGGNILANSSLALTGSNTFQIETNLTISGAVTGNGGLTKTAAASLILTGNASHSGGTTVSAGTLRIGDGGTSGSISGDIFNEGSIVFDRSDASGFSDTIFGSGSLTKAGSGTLTLGALQNYFGATTITDGTLKLAGGEDTLLPSTIVTLADASGAFLDLNGLNQEIRALAGGGTTGGSVINSGGQTATLICRPVDPDNTTFAGELVGNLRFEVHGSKTEPTFTAPRQRLAGINNSFTGGIKISGGTLMARLDASLGAIPPAFEAAHLTLQSNGTLFNEADGNALAIHANRGIFLGVGGGALSAGFNQVLTVNSVISGAAGNPITVLPNNSTVIFAGNNTYAGETRLSAATSRIQVGNGGTSGSLGSGPVNNNGILRFNRADVVTVSNEIFGTGQVVQQGTGTTVLGGALTYSGSTIVQAGTLAGVGSSASATTVQTGGTLAPGTGIGTMSTAALTFNSGATLQWQVNSSIATADRVVAGDNVIIDVGAALAISDIAGSPVELALGTKFAVIEYTGFTLNGTFDSLPEGATIGTGTNAFAIAYADSSDGTNSGTFVTLTVVTPPPSGYAAWAAANGITGGIAGDHDNDGVPNGIEFFLGEADSGFTALPAPDSGGTITWPMGSGYTGTYGTDFVVETSTTLAVGSWTNVPIGGVTIVPGVSLSYTLPTVPGSIFARLKVTGPQ